MDPLYSWAIFLVITGGAAFYYGLFDKVIGKKNEGGPNRGRTRSRAGDTKVPDWAEADTKKPAAKAPKKQAPRKSVKKAVQDVGDNVAAAVSNATGANHETSSDSPSIATQVANKIPSGKDVSDMLDAKSVSNVLKINASEKPARPAKPQQKKSEPETQTKKQAQNAKKRAAEKEAAAQAEAERKKLMEKQLAAAREARGEAPGARYRSSQPPTSNAWNNVAPPAANATPVNGQLLDTIDNTSTGSSATNGTAPTPDSTTYDNLPSEEDQIAAALADSAWTTVPKGKKKKTKTNGEAVGEGSDSGVNEAAPAPVKATPAPAPKKEVKKENKKESAAPASRYQVLSEPVSEYRDPRDSDWTVT